MFPIRKTCLQFCVFSLLTCKVVKDCFFFYFVLCVYEHELVFFSFFVTIFGGLSYPNDDIYIHAHFRIWYVLYVDGNSNTVCILKWPKMFFRLLLMDIEYMYLVFPQASNDHSLHRSSCILWWCYTQFLFVYEQRNIQCNSVRGWFLWRQIIWSSFGGILHGRLNGSSLC